VLTITLDWLSATFKENTRESNNYLAQFARAEPLVPEAARNGYDTAYRDKNSVVCMWHTTRKEMGLHVIFSGTALRNVFEHVGISQRGLVAATLNAGASITRLDVAKDATDMPIELGNIWQFLKDKAYLGTARTANKIENSDGGVTIYVGSRTSEKFIRIYDKANQLSLVGKKWKRYELETKGIVARALANNLVVTEQWSGAFDGIVVGMVDIPQSPDYQKFFSEDTVLVGIPKLEKQTDREAWILSQCLPAIVNHYQENRTSEAVRLLRNALDLIDRV
jgi:Replication initiation factor